jgi:ADP-heptose:LPS heptosyltransferase
MSAAPLVVRCGAFGDIVLLTPLLRLLAARYGRPVDLIGAGPWTAPLLAHEPALGHLQLVSSRNTPFLLCPSQWALVRWLRNRGRGPVYLCDADDEIRALLRRGHVHEDDIVARAPEDAVVDGVQALWPDRWLRQGMRDPAHAWPVRHDIDPAQFRLPALVVGGDEREACARWRRAHRLDGPLVLFQPGNKRTHKRGRVLTRDHPKYWPPEHWCALARALWEDDPATQVLLCGSPPEHAVLEEIHRACGGDQRMRNLARELPVPRLLALIAQARGMVSVDTGPAHAAAALGCPLVVLFGPAPIAMWRPLGPGRIAILGGAKGADGKVADIAPRDVIDAWRAFGV